MNACRECGAQLTKKQYGDSLKDMAIRAPVGWNMHAMDKNKGGIMWAAARGPLCPACLAHWIIYRPTPHD